MSCPRNSQRRKSAESAAGMIPGDFLCLFPQKKSEKFSYFWKQIIVNRNISCYNYFE